MFLGQFLSLAVSFFVGAYVARYLGPANFGVMNYAISFATILSFLAGFGFENILKRELIEHPENKDDLIGTSFWLKFIISLASLAAINIASFFINHDFLSRILIFVFSFSLIFSSFNVISIYFQTEVQAKKNVKIQIIGVLISTISKLFFIYLGLGVIWITAIYIIDSLVLAIGLVLSYHYSLKKFFNWNFNVSLAKSLFFDSLPLALTYIFIIIYLKADQIILKNIADTHTVGLYAAAVKISEILYFIPSLICASLFPAIMHAKKTDQLAYRSRLNNLYYLMAVLSILIILPLFVGSQFIITTIFGVDYLPAINIFKIYLWSSLPMFLITAISQFLIAENRTKDYLIISFIGALTNITLNIILIPKYGAAGAAWTSVISYSFMPLSFIILEKFKKNV